MNQEIQVIFLILFRVGRESNDEDDDLKQQEATMDFIFDPGNTRSRVSLFQESFKTYWKLKCVLAK